MTTSFEELTPMLNGAAAPAKPAILWRCLAEQARALGSGKEPIPTGLTTLDALCRGGLRPGRVVVLAGAPGAGKTTLAVQLAFELALRGVHVGVMAADEAAAGLLIRIGQQLGEEREALERGEADALERLCADCDDRLGTLLLVDADEAGARIEDLSAELRRRAAGAPSALFVDSLQTANAAGVLGATSPRQRADCVVLAVKNAAKSDGHLVFVTSEVGRAFYRGDAPQEPNPLAAPKESGGIEYGVDVLLVMKSVPKGDGDVDVEIPKNRSGSKGEFRLRPNFARASLAEVPRPAALTPEQQEAAKAAQKQAHVERLKRELVAALVKARVPITSRERLLELVHGGSDDKNRALTELLTDGAIVRRPLSDDARKQAFRVASAADQAAPPPEAASAQRVSTDTLRDRSAERSGVLGAVSKGAREGDRSEGSTTAPERSDGAALEIDSRTELSPAPFPVGERVECGAVISPDEVDTPDSSTEAKPPRSGSQPGSAETAATRSAGGGASGLAGSDGPAAVDRSGHGQREADAARPAPLPAWVPAVGERVLGPVGRERTLEPVCVLGVRGGEARLQTSNGDKFTAALADLRPLEGAAA